MAGQNDQPKLDTKALTTQDEQKSITAEAQTDNNSGSGLERESEKGSQNGSNQGSEKGSKKAAKKVSAKEFEKQSQEERRFVELQMRADAVDKVMTKNGPPELDLNSG